MLCQRSSQLQKYKAAHLQWSIRTHSTLRQGSSQLQKHLPGRMSLRGAVRKKLCRTHLALKTGKQDRFR